MFALIDGPNFYVSCERLFRPSLTGVPVIVLSNNDGCAIARSEEAKRLGVTMGMPWFQIRKELGNAGIVALSANFSLYGNLSNRMMSVAAGLGPTQDVYSIDENFIGLDGMTGDLTARADHMRHRIRQWVGRNSLRHRHWDDEDLSQACQLRRQRCRSKARQLSARTRPRVQPGGHVRRRAASNTCRDSLG